MSALVKSRLRHANSGVRFTPKSRHQGGGHMMSAECQQATSASYCNHPAHSLSKIRTAPTRRRAVLIERVRRARSQRAKNDERLETALVRADTSRGMAAMSFGSSGIPLALSL